MKTTWFDNGLLHSQFYLDSKPTPATLVQLKRGILKLFLNLPDLCSYIGHKGADGMDLSLLMNDIMMTTEAGISRWKFNLSLSMENDPPLFKSGYNTLMFMYCSVDSLGNLLRQLFGFFMLCIMFGQLFEFFKCHTFASLKWS